MLVLSQEPPFNLSLRRPGKTYLNGQTDKQTNQLTTLPAAHARTRVTNATDHSTPCCACAHGVIMVRSRRLGHLQTGAVSRMEQQGSCRGARARVKETLKQRERGLA